MSLRERVYSILIVSATDSFTSAFTSLLSEIRYYPVLTVSSVSAARRILAEKLLTLLSSMLLFLMILAPVLQLTYLLPSNVWYSFLLKVTFSPLFMTKWLNMVCSHCQNQFLSLLFSILLPGWKALVNV